MKDLRTLLENEDYGTLQETLSDYHPSDVALWMTVYDASFRMAILEKLSDMLAADILNYMDTDFARETLEAFPVKRAGNLVIEMDTDEATDALKAMDTSLRRKIIDSLSPKDRHLMNRFLGYEEESAGAIMTSDAIVLKETMDVRMP